MIALTPECLKLFEVLSNSGIFLYRDKIVYANDLFCDFVGWSKEELKNFSPLELIPEEHKEFEKKIVEARKGGKEFTISYEEFPFKRKDGKVIWSKVGATTVFYEGKPCGLVFVINITPEKKLFNVSQALIELNHYLLQTPGINEFLQKACEILGKTFEVDGTIFGYYDKNQNLFYPVASYKVPFDKIEKFSLTPEELGIEKRNVIIGSPIDVDTIKNPEIKKFVKEEGFKCFSVIKIFKEKEVFGIFLFLSKIPICFSRGDKKAFEVVQKEISYFTQKLESLRKNLIANEIFRKIEEIVIMFDEDGKIEYMNDHAYRLLELSNKEVIGKFFYELPFVFKKDKEIKPTQKYSKNMLESFLRLPVKYEFPNGREKWFEMTSLVINLPFEKTKFILIGKDITREKEFEDIIKAIKSTDELTGILSFEGFMSEVVKFIKTSRETKGALIVLDVCDFVYLNSKYGYAKGDIILKTIANELKKIPNSIVGRIVADTFAIFNTGLEEKKDIYKVLDELYRIFQEKIYLDSERLPLLFNAGIVFYPDDGKDFTELWKNANIALVEARSSGEGEIKFFDPEMEKGIHRFLGAQELVKNAVLNNLFVFHYQPYFDLENFEIKGLEALVRIKTPDGKIHYPGEFIEYLEKSKYLRDFEIWALNQILKDTGELKIPISFNITPESLKEEKIVEEILERIRKFGKGLGVELTTRITFEITERVLATNLALVTKLLLRLKEMNIKVAIDDFGTGYSSLNYIKELPIDFLKIDKSFVDEVVSNEKSRKMIEIIITIAKTFGIRTIAEGVETKEQFEILKQLGCDYIQGFLFAKPMDKEQLKEFLREKAWLKKVF